MKGFRKVDADKWEFANEGFRQGQRHLLRNIQRRKPPQMSTYVVESVDTEVERLRKEEGIMMQEVVQLQRQQRGYVKHIETVNKRIQDAEQRQKQMLSFLAKLFHNRAFLDRLKQSKEPRTTRKKFIRHNQPESSTQPPDYALAGIVEEGLPFEMETFVSDDLGLGQEEEEPIIPPQQIQGKATTLQSEELYYKGKHVMGPQQQEFGPEYLVSFPEDAWSMGFDTRPVISCPGNELWDDMVRYDVPEFGGFAGGFSDIWDLGSSQGAGSSSVDKQLADESLLNEPPTDNISSLNNLDA